MSEALSTNAQRVQQALGSLGFDLNVVELPDSTRTAKEAAQAIGCQVAQIGKSLVFKMTESNMPVMVVASGPNRVNEKRLGELCGEAIEKADADFVRQKTGFPIGGVPPVGFIEDIKVFIDEDLLQYEEIWAAAGTPHAVFRLTPQALEQMTGGEVIAIK